MLAFLSLYKPPTKAGSRLAGSHWVYKSLKGKEKVFTEENISDLLKRNVLQWVFDLDLRQLPGARRSPIMENITKLQWNGEQEIQEYINQIAESAGEFENQLNAFIGRALISWIGFYISTIGFKHPAFLSTQIMKHHMIHWIPIRLNTIKDGDYGRGKQHKLIRSD